MNSTKKVLRLAPWAILAMIGVARAGGLQGSGSDARLSGAATSLATLSGNVDVSGGSAPSPGDILTAIDATHAHFTTPTGGGGGGGVTSLAATSPLAASGSTGAVTVSLNSAVPYSLGGTGQTSYAKGDIVYASATNTLSKLPASVDGYVMTLVSGVPAWAAGGGGGSTYPLTITAHTADFTATSNTFTTNAGASADIVCTLPASPSVGDVFEIDVVAAHYAKILCPGSQQLYFGTTTTGAAGYWRSNATGSTAFLRYVATNTWLATVTGSWTVNS